MKSHGCINGTLQGFENYSSPVPVIGLYIAAASAVCALLMLYDIVVFGFIKAQKWLPCKWFKLNSVTLSLIGVVVKLTVDLTTSMPSALDQLSKLAGTTSLCIYMCYIYPSVSDMKDSTNMFALGILVITVFVNMCIQLSTGVIALFFPEHIIIMCIMLVLLGILWRNVFTAKNVRRNSVATCKSEFVAGESPSSFFGRWEGIRQQSFLRRLKGCYLHTYEVNPQFRAYRSMEYGIVGDMSLISLVVLIQAAIRSIIYKKEILCTGELSDYQWSMGMIVMAQFVFIITGSFASCFRRWTMLIYVHLPEDGELIVEEPYISNPIFRGKLYLLIIVDKVYTLVTAVHWLLVYLSVTLCRWVLSIMRKAFSRVFIMVKYFTSSDEEWLNTEFDFESFSDFRVDLRSFSEDWIERKGKSSMEKLIDGSRGESIDLCNLLSSLTTVYQGAPDLPSPRLLPLVVLVRLAEVAIPESPCQDRIMKTFKKAFEILHFIEKHMHNTTLKDIKETEIAKALWRAGDFSRLLPVDLIRSSDHLPPSVDHAFRVMNRIYQRMREKTIRMDSVTVTVDLIRVFLQKQTYHSVDELGNFMQNLFAYMLNAMLAQLPDATFKAVSRSPDDEFEDRVHQSLKHFSLLQSWDGIHKWELPQGLENCTRLLDPEEPAPANPPVQDGVDLEDVCTQE